jgi:hypothetical protein
MKDAATAGENLGSGGSQNNFTVNGILDTAQRGPNQFNCSASKFDGSNDKMLKTSLSGASDGKLLTLSFTWSMFQSSTYRIFNSGNTGTNDSEIECYTYGGAFRMNHNSSSGATIFNLSVNLDYINAGITNHFVVSFNLTDSSKRYVYINGVSVSATWDYYADANIDFTVDNWWIGANGYNGSVNIKGNLGELWIDNSYVDLATDNPFWDADANRPKPVRQVISETGTTPLIALPLRGDDAGKNYGNGGDFQYTYSGPYTGARGGSEFWARSALSDGSTGYLSKTISGLSATNWWSGVFAFQIGSSSPTNIGFIADTTSFDAYCYILENNLVLNMGGNISFNYNSICAGESLAVGDWLVIHAKIGLNVAANCDIYLNGVDKRSSFTPTTIGATARSLDGVWETLRNGTTCSDGGVGFVYVTDSEIDFSQESNRNLFVDQLGYPKDLTPAIEAGTIADPLIYMKFDDTSDLGKNSGTGGNFTVNGTVTAGADVDPNA